MVGGAWTEALAALRKCDAETYEINQAELALLLRQVFGTGLQIGMSIMSGDDPDGGGGDEAEENGEPAMDMQGVNVVQLRLPARDKAPIRRAASAIKDFERALQNG